ncbi:MAG: hypothetical protein ACI9O6_000921 [Glaciecola sp.]|jgi:hypothetical protein
MSVNAIHPPLSNENLRTNDTLLWGNERCSVKVTDDEGVILFKGANRSPFSYTWSALNRAQKKGKLRLVIKNDEIKVNQLTTSEQREADMLQELAEDLCNCDKPYGELSRSERININAPAKDKKYNCQVIARKVYDKHGFKTRKTPSKGSCERILNHYLNEGEFESAVLRSRKRKGKTYPIEVEAIIQWYIANMYLQRNKPSIKATFDEMVSKAPVRLKAMLPSYNTFKRRVHDLPKGKAILAREGQAAFDEYMRTSSTPINAKHVLERVEMDAMHIVLGVKDDDGNFLGYVTVYFAIDFASRCAVGWHLEVKKKLRGERADGVMSCIRNMLSEEVQNGSNPLCPVGGKGDVVIMDHGPAYANKGVRALCKSLKISIQFTGTKRGWGKPVAEAFVKYLRARFWRNIKGYRDSGNIKNLDSQRPEHDNCVYLSELKVALEDFVTNVYHQQEHPECHGETRQQVWDRLYEERPPQRVDIEDRQVFKVTHKSNKVHSVRGVTLLKQTFQSDELKAMYVSVDKVSNNTSSIRMDIYYDANDASEIVVVNPVTGEKLTVRNRNYAKTLGKSFVEANAKCDNYALKKKEMEQKAAAEHAEINASKQDDSKDTNGCIEVQNIGKSSTGLTPTPKTKRKVNRSGTTVQQTGLNERADLDKVIKNKKQAAQAKAQEDLDDFSTTGEWEVEHGKD